MINVEIGGSEKEVVKGFLQIPELYIEYQEFILPSFFSEPYATILKKGGEYYQKYRKFPNQITLSFLNQGYKDILEVLSPLFSEPLIEKECLKTIIETFLEKKRRTQALIEAASLLDSPEIGKKKILDAYSSVSSPQGSVEILFNPKRNLKVATEERVATLLPTIDSFLDGGVAKKTLNILMAPTNTGKSTFLVNMGVAAIIQGLLVFHISLEMTTNAVLERYEMRLKGQTRQDLEKDFLRKQNLLKIQERFLGDVVVWEYPPNSINVETWAKVIEKMVLKTGPPHLIIVDYGDLFRHQRGQRDKQEIGVTFTDLRKLAYTYNAPVWSATQTNRSAIGKSKINLVDVAEDFEKVRVADNVFTLSPTETVEGTSDTILFYAAKIREGVKNWQVLLDTTFDKACFLETEQKGSIVEGTGFE